MAMTREILEKIIVKVIQHCEVPHEDGEIFQKRYCYGKVAWYFYQLTGEKVEDGTKSAGK